MSATPALSAVVTVSLPYGSDGLITLTGLTNNQSGAYVNNATVSAQIYLDDYATTVGAAITLSYVAASNGNYQGVVPHSYALSLGTMYGVTTTATSGSLQLADSQLIPCTRYSA